MARNAGLLTAPAAPAAAGLHRGALRGARPGHPRPRTRAAWVDERAVVFSGLWGVVRLTDRIPAYRCSVGVTLPVIGGLTPYWKKALSAALDRAAADGPVLDLRSGAYARDVGAGRRPPDARRCGCCTSGSSTASRGASVVSHFNKATKGRLVRSLAAAGVAPASVDELLAALRDLKYTVEERPAAAGRPRQVDVVVRASSWTPGYCAASTSTTKRRSPAGLAAGGLLAVGQLGGDVELHPAADLHADQALVPALDELAGADRELAPAGRGSQDESNSLPSA